MIATVREWSDQDGWGILDAEVGDVFVHFSNIEMKGYKSLKPEQQVEVGLVGPMPLLVEGCRYAAEAVRPLR